MRWEAHGGRSQSGWNGEPYVLPKMEMTEAVGRSVVHRKSS